MKVSKATWAILAFSAILSVFLYIHDQPPAPHKYDAFAQCIASSSAKFYGAFWCPHCRNQKNEFGTAAAFLPYVECSTPDAKSELPVCVDAGVKNYPTWVFKDGSRSVGEQSLETLSQKTSCPLPANG